MKKGTAKAIELTNRELVTLQALVRTEILNGRFSHILNFNDDVENIFDKLRKEIIRRGL